MQESFCDLADFVSIVNGDDHVLLLGISLLQVQASTENTRGARVIARCVKMSRSVKVTPRLKHTNGNAHHALHPFLHSAQNCALSGWLRSPAQAHHAA